MSALIFERQVEWDTLATSYWVEYKQVEILDDKAASFGSEYMERDFESDEKESDTEALENLGTGTYLCFCHS